MPAAAAVIGHGGFGTTMTALAAGVPQVVMPLFAFGQKSNAEHVAAVKVGIELPGGLACRSSNSSPMIIEGRLSDD